jgi:hypothetical protein
VDETGGHPIWQLIRLLGRRLDRYAVDLGPGSVRVLLIVASYALFAYAPVSVMALVLWTLVIWLVPRGYQDRDEALQLRDEVLRLREFAQTSADIIATLERDLEMARTRPSTASGCGHPVYRRVGLHENAPAWVVAAVRRAYRAKLHPDAHPTSRKAEAERRFKVAEAIFNEIAKLRRSM